MMDSAGWVGRGRMTDQTAAQMRLGGISQASITFAGAEGSSNRAVSTAHCIMTQEAVAMMYRRDYIRARVATGVVTLRIVGEIGHRMSGMNNCPVRMAIKTTDSQVVILNNSLHTIKITGLDLVLSGRVMAGAAIAATMEVEDAVPVAGGKGMAGVTRLSGGYFISAALIHGMGGCRVISMRIESGVAGVAGGTLSARQMTISTAYQRTCVECVTAVTIDVWLAAADKRCGGGDMATGSGAVYC